MPRRTRCAHCKRKLDPGEKIHQECIEGYAEAQASKAERAAAKKVRAAAKVEREETRARKEAIRSVGVLEEECRKIVQAIARIRDRHRGCISCELPADWDGQWHGSHLRSHGACSSLQFHLWNINRACWICNKLYSGRIDAYRLEYVKRYGQERLDWIDAQPKMRKYTRDYLARFKKVMGKRLRRLEKSSMRG